MEYEEEIQIPELTINEYIYLMGLELKISLKG